MYAGLQNALKLFPDYFLALERLSVNLSKAVTINPHNDNYWYSLTYVSNGLT